MSKSNEATLRYEQVTGTHYGYGSTPRGWMPAKKEKKMSRFTVEQKGGYITLSQGVGSRREYYMTKEEALELSLQLEKEVERMEEQEAGVCPRCKDTFEEMDGTSCMLCSSGDWAGVRDEKMTPAEIAKDKAFVERMKKEEDNA